MISPLPHNHLSPCSPPALLTHDDAFVDTSLDTAPSVPKLDLDGSDTDQPPLAPSVMGFGLDVRGTSVSAASVPAAHATAGPRPVDAVEGTDPHHPLDATAPSLVFTHASGAQSTLPAQFDVGFARSVTLVDRTAGHGGGGSSRGGRGGARVARSVGRPTARSNAPWTERSADDDVGFVVGTGAGATRGGLRPPSRDAGQSRTSSPTAASAADTARTGGATRRAGSVPPPAAGSGTVVVGGGASGRVLEVTERSQQWEGGLTVPPYLTTKPPRPRPTK